MTFVGVEIGQGRSKLRLIGGRLAPRVISFDATGAKVALVATTALLLGGDVIDLEFSVGPGAWLEIVETAGTVAYDANGEPSRWNARVGIAQGGLLLWHGEPFVVADGANTVRSTHLDLDEKAVVCIRETVVLGRSGEIGGALRIQNRVRRCGRSVLVEDLDLADAETRALPGVIGTARVVDTVTLLGAAAPEHPSLPTGTLFGLDSAGSVGRVLRSGLAGSPAPQWWAAWSRSARVRYASADR